MKIKQNIKADEKETQKASFYKRKKRERKDLNSMVVPVAFSLIFHMFFFILLIFVPKPSLEKYYDPTVIDVRMVSPGELQAELLPTGESPSIKMKPETPKETPETPEPKIEILEKQQHAGDIHVEKPSKPEPEVSLAPEKAPRKKVKESLKKKTYQPSRVVRSAIERLEKETETVRPDTVTDAIERLRKNLNKRTPEVSGTKNSQQTKNRTASKGIPGENGTPGGKGLKSWEPFAIYNVEIAYQIQRNWAFSEQLTRGRKDLETLVGIKILANGDIKDIWFDKKSGNHYLDESAIRAIKKSSPLPPLPKDFTGRFYKVGLRFTPKGITH